MERARLVRCHLAQDSKGSVGIVDQHDEIIVRRNHHRPFTL